MTRYRDDKDNVPAIGDSGGAVDPSARIDPPAAAGRAPKSGFAVAGSMDPEAASDVYRAVADTNCQGLMVATGVPPKLAFCNEVMAEWLGYSAAELLAMQPGQIVELIHEDDRVAFFSRYQKRLETDEPSRTLEFRAVCRDGSIRWFYAAATRIQFAGQSAMLGMYFDITERKGVEQSLRDAVYRNMRFVQSTLDGYILADDAGVIEDVNPAYCAISGYTREELVGTNVRALEAELDARAVSGQIERMVADGSARFTTKHRRKNGSIVDLDVSAAVVPDGDRNLVAAFARDISVQRQAEEAYRESAVHYKSAFDESPIALWEEDFSAVRRFIDERRSDGVDDFAKYFREFPDAVRECASLVRVVDVNEAAVALYGAKSREELKAGLERVFTEDSFDVFREELSALADHRGLFEATATQKRFDGTEFDIIINISIPAGFERTWARVFVSILDTSPLKRAMDQLAESERKLDRILQTAPVGMGITVDRRFTFVNSQTCDILGYDPSELIGKSTRVLHDSDESFERIGVIELEHLSRSGVCTQDVRVVRKDGGMVDLILNSALIDRNDPSAGVISSIVDITARRDLEAQLRQSQKMEAIGRLAGGVAHDLNNLLTVINGFSELALSSIDPGESFVADIQQIRDAGRRAETLTRQLLAFSRKQVLQPQVLDVNTMLRDLEDMVRRLIGEDIEFLLHTGKDATVFADRGQLEQVMLNLFINARDAMARGGTLNVGTSHVDIDAAYVGKHPGSSEGSFVMITVADTGEGIDPSVIPHIFEPFFTTKETGRGTGLGLSTAYGIVQQSGGHIAVYSTPGRGTTFRVYLPVHTAAIVEEVQTVRASEGAGGSGTILVVEDEQTVRSFVCRALKRVGYSVLEAPSGEKALEMLAERPDSADLILTDVVMPGMSGHELAEKLAQEGDRAPVVYMTGYSEQMVSVHGLPGHGVRVIRKPFSVDELTECVRTELARASG